MRPEDVGFKEENLVLGKHSGRHALNNKLKQLGIELTEKEFDNAFYQYKELADKKKEIFDEDLIAIVGEEKSKIIQVWELEDVSIKTQLNELSEGSIALKKDGNIFKEGLKGNGSVDISYKAIEKIIQIKAELMDYKIRSISQGKDALAEVSVKVKVNNITVRAQGIGTDIIIASIKAYIFAINKILYEIK